MKALSKNDSRRKKKRHFSKEDRLIDKKYMKKSAQPSLILRNIQMQMTMRYLTLLRMAQVKETQSNLCCKDEVERNISCTDDENVAWKTFSEK